MKWARWLGSAGVGILFGLLVVRATQSLSPQTPQVPLYNSDCTIPVWQLTALLLAWWSLRQDNELVRAHAGSPPPRRTRLFRARTVLLSFLSIWTSTVSGPLLVILATAEAVRVRLLAPSLFEGRRFWRRWGGALSLIVAAVVAENLIRFGYRDFARHRFGLPYRTQVSIDWEYLGQNARVMADNLTALPFLPWLAVGTVGACVSAAFLWRTRCCFSSAPSAER